MKKQSFGGVDWLMLILVIGAAAGVRYWYFSEYTDGAEAAHNWQLQESVQIKQASSEDGSTETSTSESDQLVENIKKDGLLSGFRSATPLAGEDELTAHVAPGYFWMRATVEQYMPDPWSGKPGVRWIQLALSSLTAGIYYCVARRAFGATLVGLLAGLLCAINPFSVINCGELADGSLAGFLLALSIGLGMRVSHQGGALSSLLFGLVTAALALVRASFLPYSLIAVLWFLWRSRKIELGWVYAMIGLLSFLTLLTVPWSVRNYQEYGRVVPIADSVWWHLWVGNNPSASGGPFESEWLEAGAIPQERQSELGGMTDKDQPARLDSLSEEVLYEWQESPGQTAIRRLRATLYFFTGQSIWKQGEIIETNQPKEENEPGAAIAPPWLSGTLYGWLLGVILFSLLGWRWAFAWASESMPFQLALIWIPIPYVLSHAEWLHGPRLPLDGPLCCLAALAIVCLVPGIGGRLIRSAR